jgi:hypothetical protein
MNKNKNKNIYYSNQWAHNRGKQIAYIDYCHWRQLYIYINTIFLVGFRALNIVCDFLLLHRVLMITPCALDEGRFPFPHLIPTLPHRVKTFCLSLKHHLIKNRKMTGWEIPSYVMRCTYRHMSWDVLTVICHQVDVLHLQYYLNSQICINRSPLEKEKYGLLRQVTS